VRFFAVGAEPVGVIALGQLPTGVIAIGQVSTGVIAIGQGARGFIAVGQLALGFVAFGQLAIGVLWAGGQLALGGTSGVAMLPLGIFGFWNPWRGRPEIRPLPVTLWSYVKLAVAAAIVVLFAYVAAAPVIDAIARPDGIFRPPAPMR
jgi:hypothetical protein